MPARTFKKHSIQKEVVAWTSSKLATGKSFSTSLPLFHGGQPNAQDQTPQGGSQHGLGRQVQLLQRRLQRSPKQHAFTCMFS